MIRSFIAIEIPEEIRKKMYESFAGLHRQFPSVKWVDFQNMHLTLRFLGDVSEEMLKKDIIPPLSSVLQKYSSMNFALKGVGLFPSSQKPRIFWVGMTGDVVNLKRLQYEIVNALKDLPLHVEERDFHPHITLGRIKENTDRNKWQKALEEYEKVEFANFSVSEVILFQSKLTEKGPIYTRVETFPLVGSPKTGH